MAVLSVRHRMNISDYSDGVFSLETADQSTATTTWWSG
jgi:hypothetical protein